MTKPISPDYGQQFLLPPALEDWVGRDHPVRFIREFVDQLDLAALGFAMPQAMEGRPPYAPGLLLKIWLYGYSHRIRSSRKLEVACGENMALIWLSGLIRPDHNTLWRFWRDNKKALRALFEQSVKLALKAGLVGLVLQAVDGTKIQAVASNQSAWSKAHMEKLLAALESELDQAEKQIEQEGPALEGTSYRLPEQLADKQALRQSIEDGLRQLDQDGRRHYHRHEPEARRMKCAGKQPFAYNAQAVVDQQHGVVVAAEVTDQEDDSYQLVKMTKQAHQNLGAPPKAPLTVADGNYGTGSEIALAAEQKLDVLVHPRGSPSEAEPYHAAHFRYEDNTKTVSCPQERRLDFSSQAVRNGQVIRTYRCHIKDCPVRQQCTGDAKGRRVIEIWPHTPAVQAMRSRLQQKAEQEQLRRRSWIIERHFGHIKQHDQFRRWTVRGMENVRTQWALINLAINLRALYQAWRPGR